MQKSIFEFIQLSFHLFKVFFNLLRGIWKISNLKYCPVSIFGGTHLSKESIYIKKAHDLARKLAENDVAVLTGGGPGIMEAANCGAAGLKKNIVSSVAIGIRGLDPLGVNKCAENTIFVDYFFARKWLMLEYSVGFAIFPGGVGTLDELAELLTLIQTKRRAKSPIVLIGKDFWKPFCQWLDLALQNGLVSKEDTQLFSVTDDIDEAFELLRVHCEKREFSFFVKK